MKRLLVLLAVLLVFVLPAVEAKPSQWLGGDMPAPFAQPAAEPGVAVAGDGTVWAAAFTIGSPPDKFPGIAVWKSGDGGRSYTFVPVPLPVPKLDTGYPFWGLDVDIAAAPEPNESGQYNVYAVALGPLLPTTNAIYVSRDGGATWVSSPIGGIPGPVDRPWVAADGACGLYLVYRNIPWVIHHYDFCDPSKTTVATDPVSSPEHTVLTGKIAVDPTRPGHAYLPMEVCEHEPEMPELEPVEELFGEMEEPEEEGRCIGHPYIALARTTDGGATWTSHEVARVATGATPIWPTTVAVGGDGRVHITWFDDHEAYVSSSSDAGESWSAPLQLNPSGTAAYPTIAAGPKGEIAVFWYGTATEGDANTVPADTVWDLRVARSKDGRKWTRSIAERGVHVGVVCTHGSGCSDAAVTRTLFDDFGAFILRDGRAGAVYTTDQPGGGLANDHIAFVAER